LEIGLVGLPLVGKTTVFNLLTGTAVPTGIAGDTRVHKGTAPVPDKRLDFLAAVYLPQKVTCARVDFKDIPGLDPRRGDRAANARFLAEVRGADALCFVVRAFADAEVPAYFGAVTPYKELLEVRAELLLGDILLVEKRLDHIRTGKKISKEAGMEIAFLERCLDALNEERPVAEVPLTPEEKSLFISYGFLTDKPVILAVNLDEKSLRQGDYPQRELMLGYAAGKGIPVVETAALIEAEITELPSEERTEFLRDLGLEEPGIARLAAAAYRCLGLISFYTVVSDEVRAWTIRAGANAKKAAGKVHSDMERGFIRAEVFRYEDLFRLGTPAKVREAGLFRLEGRDYTVQEGDVIQFRFKV
jgi:GTP-binding protein YchF